MTPYLKGNVLGPCPNCEGKGEDPSRDDRRCRTCKGRGIVGKHPQQVIAETLAAAPPHFQEPAMTLR